MDKFYNILHPHLEIMISQELEISDVFYLFGTVSLKTLKSRLKLDETITDDKIKEFITTKYSNEFPNEIKIK